MYSTYTSLDVMYTFTGAFSSIGEHAWRVLHSRESSRIEIIITLLLYSV